MDFINKIITTMDPVYLKLPCLNYESISTINFRFFPVFPRKNRIEILEISLSHNNMQVILDSDVLENLILKIIENCDVSNLSKLKKIIIDFYLDLNLNNYEEILSISEQLIKLSEKNEYLQNMFYKYNFSLALITKTKHYFNIKLRTKNIRKLKFLLCRYSNTSIIKKIKQNCIWIHIFKFFKKSYINFNKNLFY